MYNFNYAEVKRAREERCRAHAAAVSILGKRTITAEDRQAFDRAMSDVDRLGRRVKELETGAGIYSTESRYNSKLEEAFVRYVKHGEKGVSEAELRMLSVPGESRDVSEGAPMLSHIGTYSGLGYFVPTGFRQAIEQATKYFAPLLEDGVCTVMNTDTGNVIPFPTSNDTSQQATIVGEAAQVNEQDVTASQVLFAAYKLSSGLVKMSVELLQDSAFDIDNWLGQRFGERYGRGLEAYFTTGTGQGQPTGILTAIEQCGVSPVISVGSSANDGVGLNNNSIGSQDIVNLEHGVDISYRRNARYMLHDSTLQRLQNLLDKYGRPLWTPGMQANVPDMLNGYPYTINQSFPSSLSGGQAGVIAFGDFSKYVIRRVNDLTIQRLSELYAVTGQVGFISFARVDGNLVDAGTHPLNILEMHS